MAIDGCPHTFDQLATDVLPKHMERMRAVLSAPLKMEMLGSGKRDVLRQLARMIHHPYRATGLRVV